MRLVFVILIEYVKNKLFHAGGDSFVSATGLHSGIPLVFANKVNKPVADYLKEETVTKLWHCIH